MKKKNGKNCTKMEPWMTDSDLSSADEDSADNDSDAEMELDEKEMEHEDLNDKLRKWYFKAGVTRECMDELLSILRSHNINVASSTEDLIKCNKNFVKTISPPPEGRNGDVPNMAELKSMMHVMMTQQTQTNRLIEQVIKQEAKKSHFPIKTMTELMKIDNDIQKNPDTYIGTMASIILTKGLKKSITNILHVDLVKEFNYDGVKGKHSLKEYKNFDAALFNVCKREGYTEKTHAEELRQAFRLAKGRFYKAESLKKKADGQNMQLCPYSGLLQ